MAAVAQYYYDNLRSEVLKGMDEKVRQGWPTGLAAYGYINVQDREEPVIPHPDKSRVLDRIGHHGGSRLLNAYLAGTIEEAVYKLKSNEL